MTMAFEMPQSDVRIYAAVLDDHYNIVTNLLCQYFYGDEDDGGVYEVEWSASDEAGNYLKSDVYRVIFLATDFQGNFLFASHGDVWLKY